MRLAWAPCLLTPLAACGLATLAACGSSGSAGPPATGDARPDGWTDATHSAAADPDYALLFDAASVHRMDIRIDPDVYATMRADMEERYGAFGEGDGGQVPQPPPPEAIAACVGLAPGTACEYEFEGTTHRGICREPPPGRQGPALCAVDTGPGTEAEGEPIFVPVTVEFMDLTWWHVGMRYKGNSSLRSAWRMGVGKLAFRLDFDQFEDTYPEILDQRFFGFKKMTFSNSFKDRSLMRDRVAADIFRDAGVPAARGAFCRVYVDVGQGPTYWGLYTMIEDPSNKMLDTQFSDDGGNLYKPEGQGARWVSFDQTSFVKKTNEEAGDWGDVRAAIDALHARDQDAADWRAGLDAVFDTAGFLRYLAVNTIIQNWDAYGRAPHNYYLYGDPADLGRLTWIPWDLNEALRGSDGMMAPLSLGCDEVGSDWPLIRFLLDDPVYRATYHAALRDVLEGPFRVEPLARTLRDHHDRIAPWVVGVDGEIEGYTFLGSKADFETSLTDGTDGLIPHVEARAQAASEYLGGP